MPTVEISDDNNRRRFFKKLLVAMTTKSPVQARIQDVVRDLSLAYQSANVGAKELSYWRCLEHTTRTRDGNTRLEKEIIKIFQNYYPQTFWRQMGDLILTARNNYVHQGLLDPTNHYADLYLNWFQKYAEKSLDILLWLFENRGIWEKSAKIDYFFDLYSKTDDYLKLANVFLKAKEKARKTKH